MGWNPRPSACEADVYAGVISARLMNHPVVVGVCPVYLHLVHLEGGGPYFYFFFFTKFIQQFSTMSSLLKTILSKYYERFI